MGRDVAYARDYKQAEEARQAKLPKKEADQKEWEQTQAWKEARKKEWAKEEDAWDEWSQKKGWTDHKKDWGSKKGW